MFCAFKKIYIKLESKAFLFKKKSQILFENESKYKNKNLKNESGKEKNV